MNKYLLQMTAASLWLAIASSAQAHYLWLEPVDGETHLCFGEYENALREKAGGRLDSVPAPQAWINPADGKRADVALERKHDHFALKAPGMLPLIAQETGMKVKDLRKNHIGIVKPMYYTRYSGGAAEGASALDLDLQPLGGGKVRVSLHGKPLSKAKLNIFAPNQWMREYETDDAGETAVDMPWTGLYVLEVVHVEPIKGEYQGEAYEGVRHVSTLTFQH